jgi:hypothetical protein
MQQCMREIIDSRRDMDSMWRDSEVIKCAETLANVAIIGSRGDVVAALDELVKGCNRDCARKVFDDLHLVFRLMPDRIDRDCDRELRAALVRSMSK